MKILPAMDLIDGKCVRLYQGDFDQASQVGAEPKIQFFKFIEDGAKIIHIVDLDGARLGYAAQYDLISTLSKQTDVPIQIGGGIRSIETVVQYVEAGASRIVLGTAAIENPAFVKEALQRFPNHIVIGIDAKNEKVATQGWKTVSEVNYIEFAKEMEALGAKTIVFTDISRDGTMQGPNLTQLKAINDAVSCTIVASGGIRNMDDLKAINDIGITEAIVGKAIYEGSVTLKEALLL